MWDAMLERVKAFPHLAFLHELFEQQLRVYERCEELLMGERRPLETGVLMALLAYLSKTHREIYPVLDRSAPEPVRAALAQIRRATGDDLLELLTVYFLDDRIPRAALQHLPDESMCRWFARMFIQPAAPWMLDRTVGDSASQFRCPRCRHLPQFALDGRLACSLCMFEWSAPDRVCPSCRSEAWQSVELPSALPHVELLVCPDCKRYLKRVGRAEDSVPFVDELASVDLDDRARAQGWKKIEPNLLDPTRTSSGR